jgi:glutathione peroxidase-family protein
MYMMKSSIIIFVSILLLSFATDIYSIQYKDYAGNNVGMSSFINKKLIITAFNAKSPDLVYLRYLNQLQAKYPGIQVIAIPALDFKGLNDVKQIATMRDSEKLKILIGQPGYVRKNNKTNQHPLFRWLTNIDENTHFDNDVEMTEQLFLVSAKGTLFGVLEKNTSGEVLEKTLSQKVD